MSWISMLYQTYENNKQIAGKSKDGATLPITAHMLANSQLEVMIDADGNFKSVSLVEREDEKILIPVTEDSASRSSGIAPHALSDTLSYIAGDYANYISEEQKNKTKTEKKFQEYIDNLRKWQGSEYSHPKVHAIYQYLIKKKMIQDLVSSEIISLDEHGMLKNKKISNQPYENVLVRFSVLEGDATKPKECWRDISLMQCYKNYYLFIRSKNNNICFITGNKNSITNKHPRGIVEASNGAKLISANDTTDFTFRGRFIDAEEACTVSYEASQKAHNALLWLAAKQGVTVGTKDKRTYICWNPNGKKVPYIDVPLAFEEDEEEISYTEDKYRKKLYKAVQGYRNQLDDNDDIVIIGLDAATTGRLSVVYYDELKASAFLDHLRDWNETCNWYFTRFTSDKKPYQMIDTPKAKKIIYWAYGIERENKQGENYVDVNDKLLKEQVQRIYYCIVDHMALPKDIVHAIVCKASNPLAYKSRAHYENVLSTACALIKKDKGGNVPMVLDKENTNRSYLFGRLLAVAEVAERNAMLGRQRQKKAALDIEEAEDDEMRISVDRPTNATRMQAAFVNRPFSTWNNLKTALSPYLQRLPDVSREYYEHEIQEIICQFEEADLKDMNKSLKPEYLLGYYLQRKELYTPKNGDKKKEEQ